MYLSTISITLLLQQRSPLYYALPKQDCNNAEMKQPLKNLEKKIRIVLSKLTKPGLQTM